MQYSTLMSFGQMKDHLPVLPQLTQTWVQRSSRVISGTCKNRVKWTKISYISASGGTTRLIIANLIEHSMDSTSMVVMTPKVKVYGSKVKFSTWSNGNEIWYGESLRGYCTSGPYFWRLCAFSQKIKQLRTKYPMDLVRNVPRNSKITVLLQ